MWQRSYSRIMPSRASRGLKESALPYRTVEILVKVFNEGLQNVADMHRPGRPSVREAEVHAVAGLMDSDRYQTICELS
ncbi:uncharacterized protein TNIN_140991 [Trichonephila inaurata madagascariensis]|uniref:Uncharacterized protein n=1 Tax=Trichonephila inaurata madagascariensis TaxID=2747483 RepID=A0A8X6Y9H1_9ARAC|nr:uncharacterized protein TNIN_140991 [Trichonephila inaurata madagascariensis]